jgi:hypothetical protein
MDWLANWGPMLLVFVVWVLFMVMMRNRSPQNEVIVEMRRHNDALEKHLASIDDRLRRLEDRSAG